MADTKEAATRKELAEAYGKLKAKGKATQVAAKQQGEELVRDAITVASGGALGYYMGMMEGDGGKDLSAGTDEYDDAVSEAQQIAGIDIDLLVGGAAAAAGLMKLGGKMSDTLRAVGIGGLAEWAGRTAYESGLDSASGEEEED